jgi:signal transduction histidine kinase
MLQDEIDEVFAELKSPAPSKSQKSHEMCNEIIEMLSNNARRIQDRVTEIADCVKSLNSPLKFPTCKIFHVVASVFDTLKLVAQEKGISLHHVGLQDLPPIQADEGRLFSAFYNLVNKTP